jgi:hypothetical protein
MKNIYKYMFIPICLSIFPAVSQSASLEIDRALEILLADYDMDNYLQVRDESTLSSGYYLVQPGDTLDEIIVRLVGDTPIRKNVLREAFVHANPNSFRNSNPNYMLAGIRLRVPDADDIIELLFDMNSPTMQNMNQSRESWVRFP